jgi:hypothetical protein
MQSYVDEGSTRDMTPPEPVKVILGYWTAWPDSGGTVRYYPDIYSKDQSCGADEDTQGSAFEVRSENTEEREQPRPQPRFIPDGQVTYGGTSGAVWTESEAR